MGVGVYVVLVCQRMFVFVGLVYGCVCMCVCVGLVCGCRCVHTGLVYGNRYVYAGPMCRCRRRVLVCICMWVVKYRCRHVCGVREVACMLRHQMHSIDNAECMWMC